jgi:hypothetical protein
MVAQWLATGSISACEKVVNSMPLIASMDKRCG